MSGGQAVESLPEEQTIKSLFQVPPKDTPGFDDVHFIYVRLLDSAGKRIDDMIYWRSKGSPKYGAERLFYALNRMPVRDAADDHGNTAAKERNRSSPLRR